MKVEEVEERYLSVPKRCGTVSGVWPYVNERRKKFARLTMYLIAVTGMSPQIAHLVVSKSVDAVIEQCPFLIIGIGIFMKVANYSIHEKELRKLYAYIFNDWTMDRSKNELDIMDKHARKAAFFSNIYVVNGIFCWVIFTAVAITPRVLDLIVPKNESRGVGFIYPAYYGLDEEEYYYLLMGHMLVVITGVYYVYISADATYITIIQHACGLLNVSGYRFESAISNIDTNEKEDATHQRVRLAVMAHQYAMQFVQEIQRMHETYLFIGVGLIMISFSITLVKISTLEPSVEFYKYCGFLIVQFVHLFFLSLMGHFVIVAQDSVYNSIYAGLWYFTRRRTAVMHALALRRCLNPPVLTAGGLMTFNLESFAEILKASVSYFTVFKSA